MLDPLNRLIALIQNLSAERHLPRLYALIIEAARELTHADGATLYTVRGTGHSKALHYKAICTASLDIRADAESESAPRLAPIPLWQPNGQPNKTNVCAHIYHMGEAVNVADIYRDTTYDFSGALQFDRMMRYRTRSLLTLPLQSHEGRIIGVLQLVNAQDPATGQIVPFDPALEPLALALASSAAVTLDKQRLIQGHKDLLDAFVRVIAQAIDAKSAHTSAHCQRVPVLTELLAQAACDARHGPLKDFTLDDDGWYELRVAAWLHDCGKLATPDTLLDKATKLHAFSDRIETIQARFAACMAQERLMAERTGLDAASLQKRLQQREADCAFLEQANQGGECMTPEDQARVRQIGELTWVDYHGQTQPLLTAEDVDMLCIPRGTLSQAEREKINQHIDVTIQMLESLPFPRTLANVPEYAGGHHEKIDGSGFPKGLVGAQMSWPARMMAIADVFEALTARDRPYKDPMPLSQALGILRDMRDREHIDPHLYALFIKARVWDTYARDYLLPEQRDVTDASCYL